MAIYLLIALIGVLVLAAVGAGGWTLIVLAKSTLAKINGQRREEKRHAAMRELADERGWVFYLEERPLDAFSIEFLKAFDQEARRVAYNRVVGTIGDESAIPIEAGDYRIESVGDAPISFSYVLARPPGAEGKNLVVRRERRRDRVRAGIGWGDIDFESVEFNDRYWVAGNDKRFAYDVIHPRVMELLLDGACDPPDLLIQNGALIVTSRGWGLGAAAGGIGDERDFILLGGGREGFRWRPDELRERLDWVTQLMELWPRHLAPAQKAAVSQD